MTAKPNLSKMLFAMASGACPGECPEGALSIEEREAESFDEKLIQETIAHRKKEDVLSHSGQSALQNLHVMSPAGSCTGQAHAVFEREAASSRELPTDKQSHRNSHTGRFKCTL